MKIIIKSLTKHVILNGIISFSFCYWLIITSSNTNDIVLAYKLNRGSLRLGSLMRSLLPGSMRGGRSVYTPFRRFHRISFMPKKRPVGFIVCFEINLLIIEMAMEWRHVRYTSHSVPGGSLRGLATAGKGVRGLCGCHWEGWVSGSPWWLTEQKSV